MSSQGFKPLDEPDAKKQPRPGRGDRANARGLTRSSALSPLRGWKALCRPRGPRACALGY